jgi:hypothetical protein
MPTLLTCTLPDREMGDHAAFALEARMVDMLNAREENSRLTHETVERK